MNTIEQAITQVPLHLRAEPSIAALIAAVRGTLPQQTKISRGQLAQDVRALVAAAEGTTPGDWDGRFTYTVDPDSQSAADYHWMSTASPERINRVLNAAWLCEFESTVAETLAVARSLTGEHLLEDDDPLPPLQRLVRALNGRTAYSLINEPKAA